MSEPLVDHWGTTPETPAWKTALDQIEAGIDALASLNPTFLETSEKKELLTRLHRLAARESAVELAVLAASGDIATEAGDRDVSGWLFRELLIDRNVGRARTRMATDLETTWTRVASALADGTVSEAQARVIVKALNRLTGDPLVTPEHLAKAEDILLAEAAELPARYLIPVGKRILELIDPGLFEAAEARRLAVEEEAARRRVALTCRNDGEGSMEFWIKVPLADGLRFKTYLEAYAQPRKQSLAERGERQPYERLMGQAFIALIDRLDPDTLPHHGGDGTTVMITMTLEQLLKELGTATIGYDGDTITAGQARKLACNADIIPAVLGTDSEILDLGRTTRLATPAQRKALRLKYRTCCAEGCDIPAPWTEAHHLNPWSAGGSTDLADMVLLCTHHHHRIHDPAYDHERDADGTISFHRRT